MNKKNSPVENFDYISRFIAFAIFGVILLLIFGLAYSLAYAVTLDPIKYVSI